MIKVMLVDDEPIEREGLKLMLKRNRANFQVVTEASNGKKAVELALEHKPDLIFMDIKMPQMDGVQSVKEISVFLPNTKFIMVSAFNTFEYAQQVMKYGVREYLLKPSKLSDVLEAFDRMIVEIEENQKKQKEKLELNHRLDRISTLVESEFIISMMMDYVHDFKKEEWDSWIDLDGKSGYAVIFSFQSNRILADRLEKEQWYYSLKAILHEQNQKCLVGPLINDQVPIFVCSDDTMQLDFIISIIRAFEAKETIRLLVGAGTIVENTNYFSQSYVEAVYALETVYNHPTAKYMIFHPKLKETKQQRSPYEKEKELLEVIKEGNLEKSLQLFNSYFQLIYETNQHHLQATIKSTEEFFGVLNRQIKELGIEEDFQFRFQLHGTPMQVKEAAKIHVTSIVEHLRQWRMSDEKNCLLLNAKQYIDDNYCKQITLESVAEKLGISSYYLSKLFKEKFQITFIDYLTQVRLKRAKELLLDENMSLKEIALTIGYKDPNYFSRVFKKEMDLSPTEYKRNLSFKKK